MRIGRRWPRSSKERSGSQPFTASYAGGSSICANGFGEECSRSSVAKTDVEPRVARHGLPQAVGSSPSSTRKPSAAIEGFKESLPERLVQIGREKGVEPDAMKRRYPVCEDEARVGQKNKITRRWAKRGTRPSAPKDQRTASAYIFGAICPKDGKGAALVMPRCDTEAMNLHLAEIATQIAPGAHAAILVDQAGWHLSRQPDRPAQHHADPAAGQTAQRESEPAWKKTSGSSCAKTALSNAWIFKISFDDILDHCCDAWNKLVRSSPGKSCPSACEIEGLQVVIREKSWYHPPSRR